MEQKNVIKENLIYIVLVILVILIKIYVVSPIKVNGGSMESTLKDKDIMILDEISYRFTDIERFDIVVIKIPGEYIIKRVIGLPGETVEYIDNELYINGKKVEDNHSKKITKNFSTKVPEGHYFVLGDNRTNSVDSTVLGPINRNEIKGKTNYIVFPFSRMGKVK